MTAPRRRLRKLLLAANVVAVLAATAVLVLNYIGTVTANQAKACEQEYITVQAGLLAFMGVNKVDAVPAAGPTVDMTTPVRLYSNTPTKANPSYVPTSKTVFAYAWDGMGRITSISESSGGPAVPAGCIVSEG